MSNVFLSGETINLCVPVEEDFSEWASWFNNHQITQFLEQGKYPNTIQDQIKFYNNAVENGRFITMIKSKASELLGVISLSEVDFDKKSCQVAYVCPNRTPQTLLAPLEALALGTEHAFIRMGMERVWARHAFPGLLNWVQKTEIIGYLAEGLFINQFRHGHVVSDTICTAITKERFYDLYLKRGGRLWPGEQVAQKLLAQLRNTDPLAKKLSFVIQTMQREHQEWIDKVEQDL